MPVESGSTIAALDFLWPLSSDYILAGDDHIRLIKSVLKTQFPGALGDGFDTPILSNEAEINYLQGLTGNLQDQLDAITTDDTLVAPSGTVLAFHQVAPPLGWTQITTTDDAMLRVVDGTGGGSGGTDSPISYLGTHTHATTVHSLTEAELPSHTHSKTYEYVAGGALNLGFVYNDPDVYHGGGDSRSTDGEKIMTTSSTGSDEGHDHGDTSEEGTDFLPKYIDMIIASKD